MQLRFCPPSSNYYANHFIYEIARSRMKLEVLQSLSNRAAWLSKNNMLDTINVNDDRKVLSQELVRKNKYKGNASIFNNLSLVHTEEYDENGDNDSV